MCDASIPSMPCGAECDPLMGSYERSRAYAGGQSQTNETHTSFMPGFIQPQIPANIVSSGFGPRRFSETREIRQTFVYQPNHSQMQGTEPYYYSHYTPSPPSARDPANLFSQSLPNQSVPMYSAFNIPSHGAFGSSFPPSHVYGSCASRMANYSMQMPFTPQKCAGFEQNAFSGRNMPYGSYYPSGNISSQQQHVLF